LMEKMADVQVASKWPAARTMKRTQAVHSTKMMKLVRMRRVSQAGDDEGELVEVYSTEPSKDKLNVELV